ncbi:MAG TPA: hypothetical protein VGF67_00240 [Ktedonobacteraceae bacterium]
MKRLTSYLFLCFAIALLLAGWEAPHALAYQTARQNSTTFVAAGSGTETSLSPLDCQNTGTRDCMLQMTGTLAGFPIIRGTYTTTLTVHWGASTPNGSGGFCAPADGPTTLTDLDGDQLILQNTGTFCEIGPTGLTVPHRYTGTATITAGAGHFADVTGTATVVGFDDGQGHAYFIAWGTILCQPGF